MKKNTNNFSFCQKIFVTFIFFLGLLLRINQISNFKIYKDSFKFLLISKSFYDFKNLPTSYPNYKDFENFHFFINSYKWLYSILIAFISKILNFLNFPIDKNIFENTACGIVVISSIITALILYKFVNKITKNKNFSLLLTSFFLFSGTQIAWNGFIITDTLAGFVLILFLYFYYIKKKIISLIIFTPILYITRPELVIVPFLILIIKIITFYFQNYFHLKFNFRKATNLLLLSLPSFINLLFFILILNYSKLYNRNFLGNIGIYLLFLVSNLYILFKSFKKYNLKINKNYELWLATSILINILSIIYIRFNPLISRYINILLPLFILNSLFFINNFFKKLEKNKKYAFISLSLLTILLQLASNNLSSSQKQIDFNTEEAKIVLNLAKEKKYTNIYVPMEEAFLWNDFDKDFNIFPIECFKIENIPKKSLIVNDPYLLEINYTLDRRKLKTILFKETKSNFWLGEEKNNGWVEVFAKE